MDALMVAVITLAVSALMSGLVLLARRIRRRGAAGQAVAAAMAAFDQGFHATAHDAFVEMKAQDERGLQIPSPGPPRDGSARR